MGLDHRKNNRRVLAYSVTSQEFKYRRKSKRDADCNRYRPVTKTKRLGDYWGNKQ